MQEAHAWLEERLDGLEPSDFGEGTKIISTLPFRPPKQFQNAWIADLENLTFTEGDAAQADAVVTFCNPYDQKELYLLAWIVDRVDCSGADGPCIIWAPHSAKPTGQLHDITQDFSTSSSTVSLFRAGLDGIVAGEPSGFNLALAVRAQVCKANYQVARVNEVLSKRRSRTEHAEYLKDCIHHMIWEYLRFQIAPSIPPLDPPYLPGYKVGSILGVGSFGCVYKLHHEDTSKVCSEVVKAVEKSVVKGVHDLYCMRRMIDVMVLLSSSTWKHPNIVQLYQIYHTPTHILFRMESGGPENLYKRLRIRDVDGETQRPLQCEKICSLMSQAVEAMRHLHIGPHVCHRDIKPENYIVSEPDPQRIILKLADFDLAVIKMGNRMCRSPCGTVPFSAPEVLLEPAYDGFAADVWSLGATVLEVLCGVRTLEKALSISTATAGKEEIAREIRMAFVDPSFTSHILKKDLRKELRNIIQPMCTMLNGVLDINPATRWGISEAKEALVNVTSQVFPE